jgi:WD40 repeat protein
LEFFDTIHKFPSQIYHSALPLCPPSTWLYKYNAAEVSQGVKVVKGLPAEWGSCSRTVTLGNTPLSLACWKDTIAVGSESGDIITLDAITGSQVAVLSGRTGYVRSVTFSSDGTSLVSGSDDRTVKLWDVQTGGVVKTFCGHTGPVLSVSIAFNHTTIASGSIDGTVCLWDIQTGECHHTISQQEPVRSVSFSPTNSQHLISISAGIVHQWSIDGHQIKPTFQGYCAAFSWDGTHIVSCWENVTTVQNSDSGVIVAKFSTGENPRCCCFSPDGKLVAVAVGVTAYVWDITGTDPCLINTFTGHTASITSLAFSSSSLISASYDQSVKFWQIGAPPTDLAAGDPNSTPPVSASVESVSLQAENGIAISSDSDGVVRTWDISTGLCKESFQTPAKGGSWRDAQVVDGRLIVVWFVDEKIHVWDTEKGELLQAVETAEHGVRDLRISGDGSIVFLLAGRFIKAWSLGTGEAVGQVELEDDSYLDLLRVDGSRICVRFPNSLILGWDFGISGSSPVPLPNISSERPHLEFIGGASWWYKGPCWIKDTVTGKAIFQLSGRYASPREVQWDGQYLVAGYESGEVLILDFAQMLPQ